MAEALSIGWFWRSQRDVGPLPLAEMQKLWAEGKLDRDTLVRHSLDEEYRFAGDVAELMGAAASGESIACLRHGRRPATRFCVSCRAPICKSCAFAHWKCKGCHQGDYDRRLLSALVDYVVLPLFATLILFFGEEILATLTPLLKDSGGRLWYPQMVFSALLAAVFLLKDRYDGRSPGKQVFGLVTVDLATGRPCGALGSLQRNLFPTVFWAIPFFFFWTARSDWRIGWLALGAPLFFLSNRGSIYCDPQLRRRGDYLAGTEVRLTAEGRLMRQARTADRLKILNLAINYPPAARPEPSLPGRPRSLLNCG